MISLVLFQGANFRDLPGVIVGPDNVARLDPTKKRELLPSGSPLVRCLRQTPLRSIYLPAHTMFYINMPICDLVICVRFLTVHYPMRRVNP